MTETANSNAFQLAAVVQPDQTSGNLPMPSDVQRFESLMDGPPGGDYYVAMPAAPHHPLGMDVALNKVGEVGHEMQLKLNQPHEELPEGTPMELQIMHALNEGLMESTRVSIHFQFLAKGVENSEKGVQTLYRLQG